MHRTSRLVPHLLVLAVSVGTTSVSAQTLLGPKPYLGVADSPLSALTLQYFGVETCEDGVFNTPGATIVGGTPHIGSLSDSVDEDDGFIDGFGQTYSLYPNAAAKPKMTFAFDKGILGKLPTHVGFVWTDVGTSSAGFGFGHVKFKAKDANGNMIYTSPAMLVGDGVIDGETAEDRFIGLVYKPGIAKFIVQMTDSADWEIDHFQFGRKGQSLARGASTPEPGGFALLCGFAIAGGYFLRRLRKAP